MLRRSAVVVLCAVLLPATVHAFDHHHHDSHHGSHGGDGCGSSHDGPSPSEPSTTTPTSGPQKRVFVTSTTYAGAVGSVKVADADCQQSAAAAGLPGTFTAWISDGTTSAYDRTGDVGPWFTTGGDLAFSQKSDLQNGSPATDLLDERGNPPSSNGAWTGTNAAGLASGSDCEGWTNATAGATGSRGSALGLDTSWSGTDAPATCDGKASLICFQQ